MAMYACQTESCLFRINLLNARAARNGVVIVKTTTSNVKLERFYISILALPIYRNHDIKQSRSPPNRFCSILLRKLAVQFVCMQLLSAIKFDLAALKMMIPLLWQTL